MASFSLPFPFPFPFSLPLLLLMLSLSVSLLPPTMASTASSQLPRVDFSRMGTVAVVGSFQGIDFYSPSSSSSNTSSSSSTNSNSNSNSNSTSTTPSTPSDSFILNHPNGTTHLIAHTNPGGSIGALCYYQPTGQIFLGGTFTRISEQDTGLPFVGYTISSDSFQTFPPSPSTLTQGAEIDALYCDPDTQSVWIGGDLGGGKNVVRYFPGNGSFGGVPFGGLDGRVLTIGRSSGQGQGMEEGEGEGVVFGGEFSTVFSSSNSTASMGDGNDNQTFIPGFHSPAPPGTISTSFSRYLTPLSLLNTSSTAGPASSEPGFGDVTAIFCPAGADGQPGSTFRGREGSVVSITVRGFREWTVSGLRLGNTFSQGFGTKTFRVVSIPDNTLQVFNYTDPLTGTTSTCSTSCPLSTDAEVGAQDFLFQQGSRGITGFQISLEEWTGRGAGLHRLELLGNGGSGTAVRGENYAVCSYDTGGEGEGEGSDAAASQVQQTGEWTTRTVDTSISGTTRTVRIATVGNDDTSRPSTTWYPYISSSGNYSVYLSIPGCGRLGDCDSRTDVDIEVFPFPGSGGWTSTITQRVQADTESLVYEGYVQGSEEGGFQATVRLALPDKPRGTTSGNWDVVAGTIGLNYEAAVFANGTLVPLGTGVNGTGISFNSTGVMGNGTTRRTVGYGVYEWVQGRETDALGVMSNEAMTRFDPVAFALQEARGPSLPGFSVNTFSTLNNVVYFAGNFTSVGNLSNVLALDAEGRVIALPRQGVNGVVLTSVVSGNHVYFGGEFSATQDGDVRLNRLARYDTAAQTWEGLERGVDGTVRDLQVMSNGDVLVLGDFTGTIDQNGTSFVTGGSAIWSPSSSKWTTSGLVVGTVNKGLVQDGNTYLVGNIAGISANAANGIAYLSGDGDEAEITPGNVKFVSPSSPSSVTRKRSIHRHAHKGRSWMTMFSDALRKRQTTSSASLPPVPVPNSEAPVVFAAAYWKNVSASGSPTVTCIGGNFSLSGSNGASLGFYDQDTQSTVPVSGDQPVGIVRSLEVVEDTLFVAGNFDLGEQHGIASYDLASNTWNSAIPDLNNGSSGGDVFVIRNRPGTNTLIAAGAFTSGGSLPCVGVCSWDIASSRWSALGAGLSQGQVRTIEFAGDSSSTLLVAGSFSLADGTSAFVARYDFDNSTWTAIGPNQLPGPATAITADNGNTQSIFASGISTTDGSPYVRQWNGQSWNTQEPSPLQGSQVSQLVFVPLAESHDGGGSIENDRMLMAMGSINLPGSGNATAALYDGQQWYPYLTSVGLNGNGAAASGLFYSIHNFSYHTHHYLALGLIVLIAIAISTGLIFLLVLIGLLCLYWYRRHRKTEAPAPVVTTLMEKRPSSEFGDTDSIRLRRLGAIQEAVFGSAAVAATSFAAANKTASPRDMTDDTRSSFGYDSTSQGHTTNQEHFPGQYAAAQRYAANQTSDSHNESTSPSHMGRPTTVKYTFAAEDPAELSVHEGDYVNVLEEAEDEQWWYVRDSQGREGVVPASYLW